MPRQIQFNKGRLKETGRHLSKNMPEGEKKLWPRSRGMPIRGAQFPRQKTMGHCLVDFSASKANLVVEEDGSQHKQTEHEKKHKPGDRTLSSTVVEGLRSRADEEAKEIDSVTQRIHEVVKKRLGD